MYTIIIANETGLLQISGGVTPLEGLFMSTDLPKTMTVPEAGAAYFGLSRGASYEAAKRGDIPTIRIGKLLRVPVWALERMLASPKANDAV